MSEKKYVKIVIFSIVSIVFFCALTTIVVDPYFHYHKPLSGLAYQIDNERYQNYGIVRNFDYDAIITGTSMTENFKTSECDVLFGVESIKVPMNGGHYNEIDRLISFTLEKNENVRYVFRSLDYSMMNEDKDIKRLGEENFPTYLYDDNPFNDVNYILNKTVLFECAKTMVNSLIGGETTTFDEYANWSSWYSYGKDVLLKDYIRVEESDDIVCLSEEEKQRTIENIKQNVVETINKNPDVTFYLFIPPYSILYWDCYNQSGQVPYRVDIERTVLETVLDCENVRVFSFTNNYELVCNLDNYKDNGHYGEWINSDMLKWMSEGKYELTKDNYEAYLTDIEEFYLTYDYNRIFEE